ncbi:AMED_5909 family protein [Actinophytocola sp.]|uniref:AMED_5909 family protein n=1 Tax=Actinophytocola sp. TaxID=1872138 RepID=UPI002D7FA5F8|nr:AMED_5909 family protein [Actinophytocola sp.]HET9143639.1 AMED_5909 family protein [Actinophytocola sp.]
MTVSWQQANHTRTLIEAHDALVQLSPGESAAASAWLTYHLRSAAVYDRIAEVDRGHHHEALYWAARERRMAEAIRSGKPIPVADETGRW